MIYYLSLGSNVGDSISYLVKAVIYLNKIGTVNQKSSIYKTEPVGNKTQNDYLNAVIEFEFNDPPFLLLEKIKKLEKSIGRKQTYRWGPREIDIDIIDSPGVLVDIDGLTIPHKEMENRGFVLIPLQEINSDYTNRQGVKIKDLILHVKNNGKVQQLNKVW